MSETVAAEATMSVTSDLYAEFEVEAAVWRCEYCGREWSSEDRAARCHAQKQLDLAEPVPELQDQAEVLGGLAQRYLESVRESALDRAQLNTRLAALEQTVTDLKKLVAGLGGIKL